METLRRENPGKGQGTWKCPDEKGCGWKRHDGCEIPFSWRVVRKQQKCLAADPPRRAVKPDQD